MSEAGKKEAPTDSRPAGANCTQGAGREATDVWARRRVAETLARCLMALSQRMAQMAREVRP